MPRLSLKAALSPLAAVLIVVATGVVLSVLYVMYISPVHALDRVPEAISRLTPEQKPKPAPDVAFADAAGKLHRLDQFRGRYVLLNLWAPWCAPCVKELPALAALSKAVPSQRLEVVAVNVGRNDAQETAAFLARHHAAALGVWRDSNIALVRAFTAYGLPATILIDPQGREVARAMGAGDWSAPGAIAYFQALPLNTPPS